MAALHSHVDAISVNHPLFDALDFCERCELPDLDDYGTLPPFGVVRRW